MPTAKAITITLVTTTIAAMTIPAIAPVGSAMSSLVVEVVAMGMMMVTSDSK